MTGRAIALAFAITALLAPAHAQDTYPNRPVRLVGTPQPVIDRLNKDIVSIVAMPDYRDLIEKGGSLPESSTPAQLGQVIAQTVTDVEATIREFGLQQE